MILEIIKKSQRETIMVIENLRKRSGFIHSSIINRIQEIEERISGMEDTKENIDTTVKKCKMQKTPNPKHSGYPGHNEKMNPMDTRYRRA